MAGVCMGLLCHIFRHLFHLNLSFSIHLVWFLQTKYPMVTNRHTPDNPLYFRYRFWVGLMEMHIFLLFDADTECGIKTDIEVYWNDRWRESKWIEVVKKSLGILDVAKSRLYDREVYKSRFYCKCLRRCIEQPHVSITIKKSYTKFFIYLIASTLCPSQHAGILHLPIITTQTIISLRSHLTYHQNIYLADASQCIHQKQSFCIMLSSSCLIFLVPTYFLRTCT